MKKEEVETLIRSVFSDAQIHVDGEGCDFSVIVISEQFEGYNPVEKQKRVLATVSDKLATGELHAMSVKAYTPDEWNEKKKSGASGLVQLN